MSDDAESSTPILYLGHTGDMQVASRAEMRDYVGRGMLDGKRALITGDDSGIGPAVAVAFAKEGADVASAFFEEDNDAALTRARVEKAGRPCVLLRGDLAHPEHCRAVVAHTVEARGGLDVPVNNVAYQQPNETSPISDEQWRRTFAVNIDSFFHVTKAALAHLPDGAAIINTSSINGLRGKNTLMEYAATKCGCPRPRADSLNASTQTSSKVLAEVFGFVSVRPNRPGWPR